MLLTILIALLFSILLQVFSLKVKAESKSRASQREGEEYALCQGGRAYYSPSNP
jgi:hypothetical protein